MKEEVLLGTPKCSRGRPRCQTPAGPFRCFRKMTRPRACSQPSREHTCAGRVAAGGSWRSGVFPSFCVSEASQDRHVGANGTRTGNTASHLSNAPGAVYASHRGTRKVRVFMCGKASILLKLVWRRMEFQPGCHTPTRRAGSTVATGAGRAENPRGSRPGATPDRTAQTPTQSSLRGAGPGGGAGTRAGAQTPAVPQSSESGPLRPHVGAAPAGRTLGQATCPGRPLPRSPRGSKATSTRGSERKEHIPRWPAGSL